MVGLIIVGVLSCVWIIFWRKHTFTIRDKNSLHISRMISLFSFLVYRCSKKKEQEMVGCYAFWGPELEFHKYREGGAPKWKIILWRGRFDELTIESEDQDSFFFHESTGGMEFGGPMTLADLKDNPRYQEVMDQAKEIYAKALEKFRIYIDELGKTSRK